MCVMMVLCLLPTTALAAPDIWDGTTVDTSWYDSHMTEPGFQITSGAQLTGLAKIVNDGDAATSNTPYNFDGKTISLGGDIDLGGHQWKPIGTDTHTFNGTFDGAGHTISKLAIGSSGSPENTLEYIGLFGKAKANIQRLNVETTGIYSSSSSGLHVGVLAGDVDGNVTDCTTAGTLSGSNSIGGLTGTSEGNIQNCHSSVDVACGTDSMGGGLIGAKSQGSLTGCYATGNVNDNGAISTYLGGLVAEYYSTGAIRNCYATGNVSCSGYEAGGFAGDIDHNAEVVRDCYATGDVSASGTGAFTGGFVGESACTCDGCFATGNVQSTGDGDTVNSFPCCVGGFAGLSESAVTRCFASGNVTNSGTFVDIGGFIGFIDGGSIANCYAAGSVSGGSKGNCKAGGFVGDNKKNIQKSYTRGAVSGSGSGTYAGGFAGVNESGSTLDSCYFDTKGSGLAAGIGQDSNSQMITGLTPDKMTGTASSGNMPALNFNSDWTAKANDLKWYYPQLTVFAGGSDTAKAASLKSVTIKQFTVTFDSGSGSAVASEYGYYTAVGKPSDPTRSGSAFGGWYTDSGFNVAYDFSSAVTADITLHAKWIPMYTVTFDVNNGSAVPSQTVTPGGKITKPADPTRSGYFFDGWYTDSGFNTAYDFSAAVTADITLHAKWTQLTLASSVSNGTIYTGGRIILTPSRDGGQWSFDTNYLSCEGNTFKGLKPGKATITYTVNSVSVTYDVTIKASTLPSTGQDMTWIYILAGIGFFALAAGMIIGVRKRAAFNNKS